MSSGSSSSPSSTSSKPPAPDEGQSPPRIPRLGWVDRLSLHHDADRVGLHAIQRRDSSPPGRVPPGATRSRSAVSTSPLRMGSTVSTADFKGKIWVANFIFTRCAGPCPMMTSRMAELNQALGNKATDVELVSITVDPEYDTPEVLKQYGEQAGASPDRWKFLTGPKDQIETVVMKGFLQALAQRTFRRAHPFNAFCARRPRRLDARFS